MLTDRPNRYTVRFRINQVEYLKISIGRRHTKRWAKPQEFLSTHHGAELTEKDPFGDIDGLSPCGGQMRQAPGGIFGRNWR